MTTAASSRDARAAAAAALLFAATAAAAAQDSDLDALELKAEPPAAAAPAAAPTRWFVEGALGEGSERFGLGHTDLERLSLDLRHAQTFGPAWRGVLSARLDAIHPQSTQFHGAIFSLREVYASWQDAKAENVLEGGRINLRYGPAYGYNPTDFLRDNALRAVTTANPFTLRETRLGTFMLRGQHLWSAGSVSFAYAPKIDDERSDRGLDIDAAATNDRQRALAALDTRWSESVSSQVLLYGESHQRARIGASATALLSPAVVAYAEWSNGREPDLRSRSALQTGPEVTRNRFAGGLTYTTSTRLSVTAEYQYNGFAVDGAGWQALTAAGPNALAAYYLTAQNLQDNAGRRSWFFYATQRDLGIKSLDLTLLYKHDVVDGSRLAWADLRYHFDRYDIALQLQSNAGRSNSEFGIIPVRDSIGVVAAMYF